MSLKSVTKMKLPVVCTVFFLFHYTVIASFSLENQSENSAVKRIIVLNEMRKILDDEFGKWYPLSIDTVYGGFFSDINNKWELDGKQDKMIVTQARHIWSTANIAIFYDRDTVFRNVAAHGFKFLMDKMWDLKNSGFYEYVDRKGEPLRARGGKIKTAYGNAFAIYGLARYFRASDDSSALELAKKTFYWLEKNSYDSLYGGYFQYLEEIGNPLKDGFGIVPPKDQNSTIHLLESFTELYRVWPNSLLKKRLSSLLVLVRDKIVTKKGYMNLYFKQDWTPVTSLDFPPDSIDLKYEFDHVSFGHDVETAYLMLEACEVLGIKDDSLTLLVGKKMIDHALKNGWDENVGGIYDRGSYRSNNVKPVIIRKTKEWWAQVEALNSFLMMSEYFPQDSMRYYEKFIMQWSYCKNYLIDNQYGGWYWSGTDIDQKFKKYPKGSIWKADYHTSRALINCIQRLNKKSNHNEGYKNEKR